MNINPSALTVIQGVSLQQFRSQVHKLIAFFQLLKPCSTQVKWVSIHKVTRRCCTPSTTDKLQAWGGVA